MKVGTAGGAGRPTGLATGDDLYRIVCEYAALGHHRSGTDHGTATTEWFAELMSDLGEVTIAFDSLARAGSSAGLVVARI